MNQRQKMPSMTRGGSKQQPIPPAFPVTVEAGVLPCQPVHLELDVEPDGTTEQVEMVSLLNCNGRNFISPVKKQRGGTCGAYSAAAAVESALAAHFANQINNPAAPAPVNLSEGSAVNIAGNKAELSNMKEGFGLTVDRFYPDPQFMPSWHDNKKEKKPGFQNRLVALGKRFSTISPCKNMQNADDLDQCLRAVARRKRSVFTRVEEAVSLKQAQKGDYVGVDAQIMAALRAGFVVNTTIRWCGKIDETHCRPTHYNSDVVYMAADYVIMGKKIRPIDDISFDNGNSTQVNGQTRSFSSNHFVAIVGYVRELAGAQRIFWIIKNSHSDTWGSSDLYHLFPAPSTSGNLAKEGSSKRIFHFGNADTVHHDIIKRLGFYRFSSSTMEPDDVALENSMIDYDTDGDGVPDFIDNCPYQSNPNQADGDRDYVGDRCDNCKNDHDRWQDQSDLYMADDDDDGVANFCDNCSLADNPRQFDLDGDDLGDICDSDRDGDNVINTSDNCPDIPNHGQSDIDQDGKGDICDNDMDNDGVANNLDNCKETPNSDQVDCNDNGKGDLCDTSPLPNVNLSKLSSKCPVCRRSQDCTSPVRFRKVIIDGRVCVKKCTPSPKGHYGKIIKHKEPKYPRPKKPHKSISHKETVNPKIVHERKKEKRPRR